MRLHFFCIETSIRMDIVPDRDLFDFIDGLDVKEKDTSLNTKVCDKEVLHRKIFDKQAKNR